MSSECLGKRLRKRLIIEVGCLEGFVLGFILSSLLGAFFFVKYFQFSFFSILCLGLKLHSSIPS